jgi:hypothetical protein
MSLLFSAQVAAWGCTWARLVDAYSELHDPINMQRTSSDTITCRTVR